MSKLFLTLVLVGIASAAWTGTVAEQYTINRTNFWYEGIGFDSDDDKIIASVVNEFRICSIDEDKLNSGATVTVTEGAVPAG